MPKLNGTRWYRRQPATIGLASVVAFSVGLGIGGPDDTGEKDDLELQVAELTGERDDLESSLADRPSVDEVKRLTQQVETLESELDQAEAESIDRAAELSDREDEIAQREKLLSERESELDAREDEFTDQESTESEPEAQAQPESGCQSGQVDINTAGAQELQRIHEIGPERAQQILDLRPFGSVNELTRVNGIAEGRLGGIKAQGIACVD